MAQHGQHEGMDIPARTTAASSRTAAGGTSARRSRSQARVACGAAGRRRSRAAAPVAERTSSQHAIGISAISSERHAERQQVGRARRPHGRSAGRPTNGPTKLAAAGAMASQLNTCACSVARAPRGPTWRCSEITAAPVAPPVSSAATHMHREHRPSTSRGRHPATRRPRDSASGCRSPWRSAKRPAGSARNTWVSANSEISTPDRRRAVALAAAPAAAWPAACRPSSRAGRPAPAIRRSSSSASHGARVVLSVDRRQQGLRPAASGNASTPLSAAVASAALTGVGLVDGVGGLGDLFLDALDPFAEAVELGLDRTQHLPHLLDACCSSASVRKPICRLLSMASSVVGPASVTRCSRCRASIRPGRRSTSA